MPTDPPVGHQENDDVAATEFGLEPEMQPVVDELRRRMKAASYATDSSHVAAVITRLMPFVQHTDACLGARSRYACECGAAKAMEDAKNIAVTLSGPGAMTDLLTQLAALRRPRKNVSNEQERVRIATRGDVMTIRTRQEHIAWCIERAIAEMDYEHAPKQGIVSMMSDLNKHPDTSAPALQALCMMQLMKPVLTRQEVVNFIQGFN